MTNELGTTKDPRALIPGDPQAIEENVVAIQDRGQSMETVGAGLGAIDSGSWAGKAADKFRDRFSYEPAKWLKAGDAFTLAANAMSGYADILRWAQTQATEAIALWKTAEQTTKHSQEEHDVRAHHADIENQARAAAGNPDRIEVPPWTDLGERDRIAAVETLTQAREQVKVAGDAVTKIIGKCRDLAPEEPSVLDDIGDFFSDLFEGTEEALETGANAFLGLIPGVVSGDEALKNWGTLAQGMSQIVTDPGAFASALLDLDTWAKNPAKAIGHLLPDLALAFIPGAAIAKGAEKAAKGGRALAREAIPEARSTAIAPGALRCENDPVSVATGQVVLIQQDVELPGVLPLVISRTHLSSYRVGGRHGSSWASTWDERIEFDTEGFIFFRADGVVLFYPHPVGTPVLPAEGPRWPLELCQDGYQIHDPETGLVRRFTRRYGSVLPITQIRARVGHSLEFDHDPLGTPAAIRHSGGYQVRVESKGGLVTGLHLVDEQAKGGEVELIRYRYNSENLLSEVVNSSDKALNFSYDEHGRLTRWQDRNEHWYSYIYDSQGRCIRNESSSGYLSGTFQYLSGSDETAQFDPDESSVDIPIPHQERGSSQRITVFTDANGHSHTFYLNALDQVVREIDPLGNETRTSWDRYDRLQERTDPLGRVTKYDYDKNGCLIRVTQADGTQFSAEYNALWLPRVVTEPDGAIWQRRYNPAGNLVELINPLGASTQYRYDKQGHLSAIKDADGNTRGFESNPAGLPVSVTDEMGATTRYKRDSFGRVVEMIDPVDGITTMGWTLEGKPSWRKLPDGATERWDWDAEGNLLERTDPAGHSTLKEYGAFDVMTAEIRPDGSRLEYSYDPTLQLSKVTNPQKSTWDYEYDSAGRLISEKDFSGRELKYSHNSAGELEEKFNGAGEKTSYVRDELGRVRERHAGESISHFVYDPAGRITQARNRESELHYEYNALGQVLTEAVNGRVVQSTYDSLGRRTSRMTSSGSRSEWTYNAAGRAKALTAAGRTLEFEYDNAGREVARNFGENIALSQSWDANHRLSTQILTTRVGASSQQNLLQRRAYSYRSDGAVARIDDHLLGRQNFDLDPMGQVRSIQGQGWSERYAYDANGNVTTAEWPSNDNETQGARVYNGGLLENAGNVRQVHDKQGRVVLRQKKRLSHKPDTWRYSWDAEDRLTGVITPQGQRWRYSYDPLGRRIGKICLGADGEEILEAIEFTWDGTTVIEQQNSDGRAIVWDYEPGTFRPLIQRERGVDPQDWSQQWVDRAFFAIVTDLVGTPTELVDEHGNIAWRRRTGLWGQPLNGNTGQDFVPLGFPGQHHDPETGFYYNFHRYYDPETSRYISQDPLRLAAGPNPQAYVPNPITWLDPLGLMGCRIRASTAGQDWGNKGAHLHIADKEVRIFPDHNGGIGATGISLSNGLPNEQQIQEVLSAVKSDSALRTNLIEKAQSAMNDMNANAYGMAKNRAPEILFLIKALEKM